MPFFDAKPLGPQPRQDTRSLPDPASPWLSRSQDDFLGAPLGVRIVLLRRPALVVQATGFVALPTGFAFTLRVQRRQGGELGSWVTHRGSQTGPEILRFGVQFSDGRKATNVERSRPYIADPTGGISLTSRGGGGGGRSWEENYWVWPLPPPGPVAFVIEWPIEDVPETRVEVDADQILEAVPRAERLW